MPSALLCLLQIARALPPPPPPPPPAVASADCPLEAEVAPHFTLTDVNPTSPTYGQPLSLADHPGQVAVLYFALPTCSHCQQQVEQLQEIVATEGLPGGRLEGVWLVVIAQRGADKGLPDLTEGTDLPVLLDTDEADVFGVYSASRWFIYLLDAQHLPRVIHYEVNLDTQRELLLDQIAALALEDRQQ